MPRSPSYGSRRATTWAVAQKPRPKPRVVRLGRPANDNGRRPSLRARIFVVALAVALLAFAVFDWRLF